jgi:hypothetical protein
MAGTGQADRPARKGKLGRTERRGWSENDSQDRTSETGNLDRTILVGQPGQNRRCFKAGT